MDTMEALLTRRSIRKYRPEPVPVEDLKEILAAGATAPSAVNMQHWYFVAVQDPAALEEVKAIMGGVVEKFQPVLEERFSRHPEQIGITNRFLSTLGGAAPPPTRGSSWQRSPWATPTSSPKCRPGGTAAI